MPKYTITDAHGTHDEIEAADMAEAQEMAEAACREWYEGEEGDATSWIDITVTAEGEEDGEQITVQIDPLAPDCENAEHEWSTPHELVGGIEENPGCHGKGGGVVQKSVCMACGCGRVVDGWAQRPDTGEQGLDSVSYQAGEYSGGIEAIAAREGARVGRAIADTVQSDPDIDREWTGIESHDGDELASAGLVPGTDFWALAEEAAEEAYDAALAASAD